MKSSEIITAVLNRYKFWASKNPNSASSFIPNANATSFYLMKNRGDNQSHIQIRLSNHGTYLKTWTDREHLGNSVNRYDPTHSINISIVFVDDSSDITNDCTGQKNCDGCVLPVCKPQTFDGQDQIGRHFKVYQYVYNSNEILPRYINAITKAIFEASYKGVYIDPLRNIQRAAKHKELVSSTELQNIDNNKDLNENINMKQNRIRLTESQLHKVIKESVKRVLKESERYGMFDALSSARHPEDGIYIKHNGQFYHIPNEEVGNYDFTTRDGRRKIIDAIRSGNINPQDPINGAEEGSWGYKRRSFNADAF